MDARHPKSGLPDFGTKIAEIGNSRFRLLAAILRSARIEIGCCRFRHFLIAEVGQARLRCWLPRMRSVKLPALDRGKP